ncbi:hypothetical protein DUI87_21745 [Hirundo rustica rustica]|uniref:Uncharacterized protein n=1 Tax=Hirundo rustica rustica TaxID=333673 RepID=A0A3M0JLL3_HIRRU|nr:hypothetical protein DUI87_21745 [Hirundo rustica rustica]
MTFATTAIGESGFFDDNKELEQGHGGGICTYEELVISPCASAVCIPQSPAISDVMECADYAQIRSSRIFLGQENGLTFSWSKSAALPPKEISSQR